MPPATVQPNEARRLTALLECGVLDTPPEAGFDDLTALAARLCDTPIALVSLIDENRQWFKSRVGLDVQQTPRDQAFCAYAIQRDQPLIISDATADRRVCDNPLVTGAPHIRFYAGVPLRTSDGQALGTLCVIDTRPRHLTPDQIDDLTALARQAQAQLELRRTVARLTIAERRAVAAGEAKATFLATMSHEIRTPLTAVLGYIELLLEANTPEPERREHAVTIKRNAEHLLSLINDVLDFSKIDSGNMRAERAACSPALKVWDVMHLFTPAAKEKNLRLDAVFATPIPVRIQSDRLRLRQILVNLVSNAIKFTPSGSVSLTASVLPTTTGHALRFQVADTGIGMTQEQVARIFQPFVQADSSTTRRFGGSGLGLAISKRLAELLGGDLTAESTPGVGSTFTLTIPIDSQDCAEVIIDWRDAPRTKSIPATAAATISGRILLAEDGVDNQRLIHHFLSRAGLTVETVGNGELALHRALAADPPFDLVLMDMHMPVMDGFDATRRLRAACYEGPIVALTASATTEARAQCMDAGCTDFLTKPIDRAALIEACRRFIVPAAIKAAA